MKPFRSRGERFLLGLELAIVLPAAALVVLGALHLRSIHRDRSVEASIQRDFSQILENSSKQMNDKARGLLDDVRTHFPESGSASAAELDKLLTDYPYIAHVFVYTDKGLLVRSQPKRLKDPGFCDEMADFAKTIPVLVMDPHNMLKEMSENAHKGMNYYPTINWTVRGSQRMIYQPADVFVVEDKKTGKKFLAGVGFDVEYFRGTFLPGVLTDMANRGLPGNENTQDQVAMMAHVRRESNSLAATEGWDGGSPEMESDVNGFFPSLTLAIKLRGTTATAIAQRFMRTSILTLSGLSLLLAGGIYLTHRNVSKELALARLKSDFVSNVSHELRTPLSLIRLYAETLELGRVGKDKYQDYYQTIRKESERLTGLINNILDFSRIEAGRKEYDFRETDLRELVRNTLESYRFQIEQSGFVFEEKIDDKVPPVRVDRESIARSLLNLVNNALKYSLNDKYLGVSLYGQNGSVKLEVVDHGIGIPHEEQQKIFDKFYRVGDPLVHNTKGSGLGLSLVRHIVQAHGGEVLVDSEPGRGSRFIITLPVGGGPHAATA